MLTPDEIWAMTAALSASCVLVALLLRAAP